MQTRETFPRKLLLHRVPSNRPVTKTSVRHCHNKDLQSTNVKLTAAITTCAMSPRYPPLMNAAFMLLACVLLAIFRCKGHYSENPRFRSNTEFFKFWQKKVPIIFYSYSYWQCIDHDGDIVVNCQKNKETCAVYSLNIEHFLQSQLHIANLLYARSMKTITIFTDFIPLSPNTHMQILQTDLHTFPLRMFWENLKKRSRHFLFRDDFINSHNLISWQWMDIVRRKLMLVTIGT